MFNQQVVKITLEIETYEDKQLSLKGEFESLYNLSQDFNENLLRQLRFFEMHSFTSLSQLVQSETASNYTLLLKQDSTYVDLRDKDLISMLLAESKVKPLRVILRNVKAWNAIQET